MENKPTQILSLKDRSPKEVIKWPDLGRDEASFALVPLTATVGLTAETRWLTKLVLALSLSVLPRLDTNIAFFVGGETPALLSSWEQRFFLSSSQ